jgi:predicted acetyltransferase
MFHARHEAPPGVADGYVSYRIKEKWAASTPLSEVQVVELLAAGPDTYKALWDYVLNTDLSQTTSCWRGRVDEPLRWLLADPRRFEVKALADDLYLRLLDLPRALASRAYRAEGELVLEVSDGFPAPSETRYFLRTGPATIPDAECCRTTREPDLRLQIDWLGAAYLGGVSFATLAAAGRVRQLTTGAIERADAMFSTAMAPFCATMF